jgi:hypothetical protein
MRTRVKISAVIALLVALLVVPRTVGAQDADTLRRELEQMRRQLETLQQQYRQAIDAMGERLRRLESAPATTAVAPTPPTTATPPPVAATPATTAAQAPAAPTPPGVMDYLRPREPFALAARGRGQLLFDMGVVGDFVANLTQRNVDKADAGTFRGRENRILPREVELNLFGQIDPYARGEVRIESGEETPGQETDVTLAEANLTLMTLPFNTQLKAGQMRNRYGWSNQVHEHDLPWVDRPGVLRAFFGDEGLQEKGVELTWVADLPFYLEALVGAFNGDNETAFGRGSLREPLLTGRVRTFFELTDEHAIQIGASVAAGRDADRRRSVLPGFDVRYKYRPEGWLHPLLTFGAEGVYSIRRTEVVGDVDVDTDGDGIADATVERGSHRTRDRFGWYAYAELQPLRRWAGGLRYDSTQFPLDTGREWAVEPYLTFWPSEFLRFRAAYKYTERDRRFPFFANDSSARTVDEFLLQASFILGAHPTHPF